MSEPAMIEQARLVAAGWQQALSGRWFHDDVPAVSGRRRLFSAADALALVDVDPSSKETTA